MLQCDGVDNNRNADEGDHVKNDDGDSKDGDYSDMERS